MTRNRHGLPILKPAQPVVHRVPFNFEGNNHHANITITDWKKQQRIEEAQRQKHSTNP